MTPTEGSVLSEYYQNQQRGRRSPDTQGLANDIRIGPDRRTAGYDFLGNLVYLDTGERVKNQDMPEDLLPSNFYPNQYNGSADSAIPEDLSQPMVGPDSAYGPYYELGPFGPYDTRDINDSRHPDNPNNRPQADTGAGGYQAPTQAEMREMAQQAQALREANEARTREAEAELAADGGTSIQGGFDQYGNMYGSQPYHYGQGPTPDQVKPIPQVDITPYPQVAPDEPRPYVEPYMPDRMPDRAMGLGDLEDQIGYDPRPRPQAPPTQPTQSAGYLRSTGEGGAGINSYYDEINAYLANHSQDEVQQAMGTYGVSQEDVDAARAYQTPQPQYARGGLSRMLKKVIRKVR